MDQSKYLLLLPASIFLTLLAHPSAPVLATTDQNEDEGTTTNESESDSGSIIGTVQNISQPVNILSHSAREDGEYLHVVGEVENGISRSIDFVKVTGTFYETNKNVIGLISHILTPAH